ncbi:MAG: protein kinase [Candidatus Berkiella sp.]
MINGPKRRVGLSRVLTPLFSNIKAPKTLSASESFTAHWQRLMSQQPLNKLKASAISLLNKSGTLLSNTSLIALQKRVAKGQIYFKKSTFGHEVIVDRNKIAYAVYHKITDIGGSTGNVKLVQNLTDKSFYLLKESCDCEDKASAEARILDKLELLVGEQHRVSNKSNVKSYLFLKIMPGMPLGKFISLDENQKIPLTFEQQAQLLLSMLKAFQGLVKHHIHHDDISNENVLIDPTTLQVSIIDFGDANEIAHDGRSNHHQHYDLRKLFALFKPIIVASEFAHIASRYIDTWSDLEANLQKAIDEVCSHLPTKTVKIRP